jgi:hypothetical protein
LLPAPTAPSEGYAGVRNLVKNPKAPTRSRSWLTSSGVASHQTAPSRGGAGLLYSSALPEGSLLVRSIWPGTGTEIPGQNRPMFRGPSWVDHSCVPLCFQTFRRSPESRVALEEDRLFRRLFPAGPVSAPKSLNIACRRRSDLWSPTAPSCRCRPSGEAGTAVPITTGPCTSTPSRESEKCGNKPVDNGDIGNNRRNLFRHACSVA